MIIKQTKINLFLKMKIIRVKSCNLNDKLYIYYIYNIKIYHLYYIYLSKYIIYKYLNKQ